ncbi:MAG: hydrogenase nickel incorporation protein HypB [Pseudomonadota bacterium]
MCDSCGCNLTTGNRHLVETGGALAVTADGHGSIEVLQGLLEANDRQAHHNREHFDEYRVLAVNLMSSPGSGKTRLLEATIQALREEFRIAVIEGDLETENDAERIRRAGVQAVQITTGTACHLDAHLVHRALHELPLAGLDLLFIENVGNLVCPASFDLGQHHNVTLLSVTEGDDKPQKYPVIFRASELILVTKMDLLPYLEDFEVERVRRSVRALACEVEVLALSAKTGEGMDPWLAWLRAACQAQRARTVGQKPSFQPHHHAET